MSVPRWQITRFTPVSYRYYFFAGNCQLRGTCIAAFVEFLLWRKLIFIENFQISCSINCSGWQMSCWGWGERWCWGVTLVSWSRLNLKLWDCEEKGWNPENFVKILVFVNKTDRHQWHWQRVMREPRWDTSNKTGAWCGGEILKLAVNSTNSIFLTTGEDDGAHFLVTAAGWWLWWVQGNNSRCC